MDSLQWLFMSLQTNFYLVCWLSIHLYVAGHGPVKQARQFTWLNSWFYSAVSLAMFFVILVPSQEELAKRLYHYSKFYEYVDVFGVRAGGGLIDLHFAFHHMTTPYLTFVRVLNHGEGWRTFAALNTFHHTLMYAFFGGISWLRPVLLITGTLQLVVGIFQEAWIIHQKVQLREIIWPNIFCLSLLSIYLLLWTRDLILREKERKLLEAGKKL